MYIPSTLFFPATLLAVTTTASMIGNLTPRSYSYQHHILPLFISATAICTLFSSIHTVQHYCGRVCVNMASHAPLASKSALNTRPPPKKPTLSIRHSEEEWEVVRPVIERLYVRERRKLRYVMEIMKEKHNFKATYDGMTLWTYCI